MSIAPITAANFYAEVATPGVVVVDYWAEWCAPCKQLAPILEQLAAENPDVKFVKVNTDEEVALASQQGVLGLPTLQVWKGGDLDGILTGGKTKKAIQKVLDELS